MLLYEDLYIKHEESLCFYPLSRVMSTSKWPLKVSEERVQMYRARRNQHLAAAVTDGDHEPEVDPYAFEEGDVKFTFSNKKDKSGGEREPGKKHKVRPAKWTSEECSSAVSRVSFTRLYCAVMDALCQPRLLFF